MINFVNIQPGDKENLGTLIDLECIESYMGGKMEDLTEFWPPRCYDDATKTLDEHSFVKFSIIPFTFSELEFVAFES